MKINYESLIDDTLVKVFGFKSFKGELIQIILSVIQGDNSMVIMPTGGGKSLCYQIPALIKDGTAIVISPLIALMKNQVDNLRGYLENESIAHVLNSSLSSAEINQVFLDVKNKKTKLIIKSQLKKLLLNNRNNLKKHPSKLILAYEPVWAIGTGLVPSPEELVSIFKYIRDTVNKLNKKYASIKLLYGGSVTPDNASSLMDTEHIDGLLIGGASLIAKKFIDICSTI